MNVLKELQNKPYNVYFTFNQQAQVLNLLRFVNVKYGIDFKKFIAIDRVSNILRSAKLLPQQKGEKILNELRSMSYPLLTRTEFEIRQAASKIFSITGIKVKLPEHLEGDCLKLDIPASSYNEVSDKLHELSTKCNAEFTKLMRFID